ncbi:hypothetical protein AWB78_07122 [Caballeronia calidae]|uniref:Uncharacterized protein n=1 Tax=Caballeronia calidae TaxID=1777139 RepID=A0A158ECZ2_9BURK|nr:hypothetical protein AWB78_07122 [Caballeronia calidae]
MKMVWNGSGAGPQGMKQPGALRRGVRAEASAW